MPLTDTQVRRAQPAEKDYKLADSGGLYLFVTTKGFKSWRLKYRFGGKEKRLIVGSYPAVSLAQAREERDAARRQLRSDKDPATERRKGKMAAHAAADATFEVVALRWHEAQKPRWSPVQIKKVEQALRRDVFPALGRLPLVDIDGRIILTMLRKVEARGAIDTAKRLRQHVSAVFGYGIAEGIVGADPASTIGKALKPTPRGGKQPALRDLEAARQLLRDMDASTSSPLVKLASWLLAYTVVRPGIVRSARWEEFEGINWDDHDSPSRDAIWRISAERMKLELSNKGDDAFEHIVPLAPQAVAVLREVRRHSGRFPYLFYSVRSMHKPMSENTIGYMYARNGYSGRHVPHGWRSTFSTVMNERAIAEGYLADREIIDAMLAHKAKGISGSEMAYNRAVHMPRRRALAEAWAGELSRS